MGSGGCRAIGIKRMEIKNKTFRRVAIIAMLASIVWGYWWLTWALAILFLFLFPLYYEIIIWGIMYDAIYGLSLREFWGISSMFTALSLLLFIIAFSLRKYLLAYEE